ncbi:expressed unknown protein [Seminavis robusta]|uniref:Uncharacterized protein n=1 Tax=Seminavis robusta TaxID=568900 RepID=A0A9N8HKU0_9STRA|nr:expressed unknown protein [Seminavis robusta]|eukprot:Sro971_g226460.1 n/a (421) ;mRNA; r:13148-14410
MRRSGSSSCMLRPKNSMDSLDSQFPEQLSVTMISREDLPSFSTERFFMLSEFHLNAHSIRFVSDLQDDFTIPSSSNDDSDVDTSAVLEEFKNGTDSFPPFLIFYILWRPDMTKSAEAFASEHILPAVEAVQSHTVIAPSEEEKKKARSGDGTTTPTNGCRTPTGDQEKESDFAGREHDSVTSSSLSSLTENRRTRLYLVVERTNPFQDDDDDNDDGKDQSTSPIEMQQKHEKQQQHFESETALAENLARHMASHSRLRSVFHGITIGVANHKRAAPGLDACLNAINFGARDRRKISRDAKCHIGLICLTPNDLLGLDKDGETDAAQNVLQTRISTEWNGKGNLKTFAYRAHAMWCKDFGMPLHSADFPLAEGKRRSGRRLGRLDEELERRFDSLILDILNFGAFLLITYFVWKGLAGELS